MHGHLKFQRESGPDEGRRSRKKAKTHMAIEDAALALFSEHGYDATTLEQIAERADISTATFFHYFRGKADVVLSEQGSQIAPLCQALMDRPASEDDLTAVRNALMQTWVATVDPERTFRTARAVASSPVLQGMSYQLGRRWLDAISEVIARRRGHVEVTEGCVLSAHVTLAVFANGIEWWVADGCREELKTAIERNFESMVALSAVWSRPDRV